MKLIGRLVVLWMLFCAAFYFFYMDDAEDAVFRTSLIDVLEKEMIVSGERADAPEQRKKLYDKMNDVMREKYDIDLEDSIMDTIEEKGFACQVKNIENSGGHGQYIVEVTDNDGKKFSIAFLYADKNLQNASEAEVMLAEFYGEKISEYPSSNIAHFVYGLEPELCAELDKIHPFHGRRR